MLKRVERGEDVEYEAATTHPDGGFDVHEALNFVWRQWKLIAGVTALGLLIGALYVARQTPLYTATAELLLTPNAQNASGRESMAGDAPYDLSDVESQIAVIHSTALLRRVVERENLVKDPEFGSNPAPASGGVMGAIHDVFTREPAKADSPPAAKAETEGLSVEELPPDVVAAVESIKGAIGVSRSGQALVLSVSFTSTDPAKAARLANAVADAYVVDKLDARFDAAKRANAWLTDRLVELKKQLHDSEEAVAQFRSANNLVMTSGAQGGSTLSQEQLGQLNGRLVAARAETAEKKARLDQLQRVLASGGNVGDLPDIGSAGAIPDLRKQQNDLKRQEADLLTRYNDRYPAVVNIRAQIADIRRAIAGEANRLAADVKQDYELALARQGAVEKALRDVTGQTDLDASKTITLRELERNASVNKTLFEDFLQRAKVTEQQSTFEAKDARVITPALPPGGPSSPNRHRDLMASLLMGLMAGAGAAYLIEMLNAGFTTPRQVEAMLRLPLLASISRMETRDLKSEGGVLSMQEYPSAKPLSRFSESVRSLRSAVQMSDVDHPPKIVMVTSTIPGEGKSTIAMMIVASAAQSSLKALLVDADMRHPSSSHYYQLDKRAGLVEYLIGEADISKVIVYNEKLRHWVLPAGGKTQNPSDLLASEKFKSLMLALQEKFDLVVLDTPPMGPVVDPVIASQVADKIVYVVRWASTARELVENAIERLAGNKKVAGVVFNHVVDAQAQKYGKYAYSHYYGGRYYKNYYSE